MPGGLPIIKSEAYIRSKLKDKANNYKDYYYFAKLNLCLPGILSCHLQAKKTGQY